MISAMLVWLESAAEKYARGGKKASSERTHVVGIKTKLLLFAAQSLLGPTHTWDSTSHGKIAKLSEVEELRKWNQCWLKLRRKTAVDWIGESQTEVSKKHSKLSTDFEGWFI